MMDLPHRGSTFSTLTTPQHRNKKLLLGNPVLQSIPSVACQHGGEGYVVVLGSLQLLTILYLWVVRCTSRAVSGGVLG